MISGYNRHSLVPSPNFLSLGMDFRVGVKLLENGMIEAVGCLFFLPTGLCLWSSLNRLSHLVGDYAAHGDGAELRFCDSSPQARPP